MTGGTLSGAYQRFLGTGPEWGEDQLTNHGPMAVEVMVRRGYADCAEDWVDAYVRRLDAMPSPTGRITDWLTAVGDAGRLADWVAFFGNELEEHAWQAVLATWWPRLLPGILAGTTHGVIRVSHVVRALLAGADEVTASAELAHALAFWAARSKPLPPAPTPSGSADPASILDTLPRIHDQRGTVATRFAKLPQQWPEAVAGLLPGASPEETRQRLTDLVTATTVRYLTHGHASPVILVHTATAPNAVLHTLPALPRELWAASLSAVWTATAAIYSAYAPASPMPRDQLPSAVDDVAGVIDRAMEHGDEHVIKFTDTAAEVFTRTGNPEALAASIHIGNLLPQTGRQ